MMKKMMHILAIPLLPLVCLFAIAGCTRPMIDNRPLEGAVDLQGHRGARGLRPENTLPAFEICMRENMTTIELDTTLTKDKYLVINHDAYVNGDICLDPDGNPAARIPIKDLMLAELKTLDCGAVQNPAFPRQKPIENTRLITLGELFEFVKSHERTADHLPPIRFNIEIKFAPDDGQSDVSEAAGILVKRIESAGMVDRSTVQSFNLDVLAMVKAQNHSLKTSALFSTTRLKGLQLLMGLDADRYDIVAQAIAKNADIISPYYLYVNREFVRYCHERNLAVLPWTVNTQKIMEKMLDCGVDGIISDYPDLLYQVYTTWQKKREE